MDEEIKPYRVVVSDSAAQMLISHARFLAQVSEDAALRLISAFEKKSASLSRFPERNPWLSDPLIPGKKYRKLLLEKRYLILYRLDETTVYIDAVVDTRQDYKWLV